jgi:hypothetical protein
LIYDSRRGHLYADVFQDRRADVDATHVPDGKPFITFGILAPESAHQQLFYVVELDIDRIRGEFDAQINFNAVELGSASETRYVGLLQLSGGMPHFLTLSSRENAKGLSEFRFLSVTAL